MVYRNIVYIVKQSKLATDETPKSGQAQLGIKPGSINCMSGMQTPTTSWPLSFLLGWDGVRFKT